MATRDRFQQLDALRAFAIMVVMLHHYINPPIILSGFGVTFLFVLSGYFATQTLLKLRGQMEERRTDMSGAVRDFYLRRYLRICPMYFIVLFITALFNVDGARDSLPWNACFLANVQTIVTGEWNGRFAPLWSLSFLEQFYLLWPFVVLVVPRKPMAIVLIAVAAVGPVWRLICYTNNLSAIDWSVSPLSSCDPVGLGALLAAAKAGMTSQRMLAGVHWAARWIGVPGYALLMCAKALHRQPWFTEIIVTTLASLAFLWLADKASRGFKGVLGTIFNMKALAHIGRMSYSIFLVHTFSELLLPRVGVIRSLLDSNYRFVVLIPATVSLAYVAWWLVERPITEMRRRMPKPGLAGLEPVAASAIEPS